MLVRGLAALYFGLVGAWALMTVAVWWRRRRAAPGLAGDPPDLGAYELARLDRGRYGLIEVMMAQLLESGVLARGAQWGERESRWIPQNKTYRLSVRSAPGPDAHELERAMVCATHQAPDKSPLETASGVASGEPCRKIESRLTDLGLLYDESLRRRITRFGWFLVLIGVPWSIQRGSSFDASKDDVTFMLFMIAWALLPFSLLMSGRHTAGGPGVTQSGRLIVDRARLRHAALGQSFTVSDVRLAVALFGADTARSEHPGVRDSYELLRVEADNFVGL
jgi:uncharacterized protein (TIGR04222 family)